MCLQNKSSALDWAACNGHVEIANALITAGADVDIVDEVSYCTRAHRSIGAMNIYHPLLSTNDYVILLQDDTDQL